MLRVLFWLAVVCLVVWAVRLRTVALFVVLLALAGWAVRGTMLAGDFAGGEAAFAESYD